MRWIYRWMCGVMVVLVVSACGEATVDRGTADTTLSVPEATQGAIEDQIVGPREPEEVFRVPVSYLGGGDPSLCSVRGKLP